MGILNPLVVARLRKYWTRPQKERVELGHLLAELHCWVCILGPGPNVPTCDNCRQKLNFDWKLCATCTRVICNGCDQCYQCESFEDDNRDEDDSLGCPMCGESCGAYMCRSCRRDDHFNG